MLEIPTEELTPRSFHDSVDMPFAPRFKPDVTQVMANFHVDIEERGSHHKGFKETAAEESVKPNDRIKLGFVIKADTFHIISYYFLGAQVAIA